MNLSLKKEENSTDPFAADIFASEHSEHREEPKVKKALPEKQSLNLNLWSDVLPRISPQVTDWDRLQRSLPSVFSEQLLQKLANSMSQLLGLKGENAIKFSLLNRTEINRTEDFNAENIWWLTVAVAESKAEIAFEIDKIFAVWLVDAMLGEVNSDGGQIRDLTLSEQAVLEFLALNLTGETNLIINAPLFKFRSLVREVPDFLRQNLASEKPSMLVFHWQIIHDYLPGIVKFYLAPEALQALRTSENNLLARHSSHRFSAQNLPNKIQNARIRLAFGSAELTFAELSALEKDDVVLLENNGLSVYKGEISGQAQLFLGDGDNVKVIGELCEGYFASDNLIEKTIESSNNKTLVQKLNSKSVWQIVVRSFEETETPAAFDKFMTEIESENTDENSSEETGEQGGLAIENLAVTLRVELEARKLSLAEVGNLRENQILELGVKPTDTVNLLIDNQIVGRGELVIVEDRLGVRISKLLR
jgi:flagellar motor switch protein FliN